MQAFLKMDAKERVTLRRVLQNIAERVKSIASKLTGAESKILLKDSDNLLTLAKELNKALKDAGENVGTQKNTAQGGVRYSTDNTKLTEEDVNAYVKVGERAHVRNEKGRLIKHGISPVLYSDEEIRAFIGDSLEGKIKEVIKAYGRVGDRLVNDVYEESEEKIDLTGYYLELDSNRIEHMNDHVENDNDPRNTPLTVSEMLEITKYIDDYDELLDYVERRDGSKRIFLSKEKADGVIVVVELISKGRSSVQPVTAWKNTREVFDEVWGKKKKATTTSQAAQKATQSGYTVAFNDIISNSDENVNKKSYSYGDERVDFWGVVDSMDEEAQEVSERLRGYMETAGEILSKTRGVELKEGEVRRIANFTIVFLVKFWLFVLVFCKICDIMCVGIVIRDWSMCR